MTTGFVVAVDNITTASVLGWPLSICRLVSVV